MVWLFLGKLALDEDQTVEKKINLQKIKYCCAWGLLLDVPVTKL